MEISSSQIVTSHRMNQLDIKERTNEASSSSAPDLSEALRRIEQQLSLNDDEVTEINTYYFENEDSNDLVDVLREYELSGQTPNGPGNILSQQSGVYYLSFVPLFHVK